MKSAPAILLCGAVSALASCALPSNTTKPESPARKSTLAALAHDAFAHCQRRRDRARPNPSEYLMLEWRLDASGRATHLRTIIDETEPEGVMARCISTLIEQTTFERETSQPQLVHFMVVKGVRPSPDTSMIVADTPKHAWRPGLSSRGLQDTIHAHYGGLELCHRIARARPPGLPREVRMRWIVAPDGSVRDLRIELDTLGDARASACMTSVVLAMRFPEPRDGTVTVRFPFVFPHE